MPPKMAVKTNLKLNLSFLDDVFDLAVHRDILLIILQISKQKKGKKERISSLSDWLLSEDTVVTLHK